MSRNVHTSPIQLHNEIKAALYMHHKVSHGQKSQKLFGPEKPFIKLQLSYSVKLVFSYVVKGIKIKVTAKFGALRRFRLEDTKRIMSPEMHLKGFGTLEKQAIGHKNLGFVFCRFGMCNKQIETQKFL